MDEVSRGGHGNDYNQSWTVRIWTRVLLYRHLFRFLLTGFGNMGVKKKTSGEPFN